MTFKHSDNASLITSFNDAFNNHDLDGIAQCLAEDCVFLAPIGTTKEGTRHVGASAVLRAVAAIFEQFPDAQWHPKSEIWAVDHVITEWTFSGTARGGSRTEVDGCDILLIREGKVALKNAFRKQRVAK